MGNKASFMLQDEEITRINKETGFSPAQIERLYSRFTTLDKGGNGSLSRQDFLAIPELAINPLCDRIVQMFFIECDEDHDRINFRQFMKILAIFRSSHKIARRESLSSQQHQFNTKQALLFDTIDPSPFSIGIKRHSRHSSYQEGLHEKFYQHHTTNQHSVHYAASTNHLPLLSNGLHHHHHHHHHYYHQTSNCNSHFMIAPLVDPDEPLNSRKQKLFFMFKLYDVDNDNLISLDDLTKILKIMVGNYIDEKQLNDLVLKTLKHADQNSNGYIEFDEFCTAFLHRDIDEALRVKFSSSQ